MEDNDAQLQLKKRARRRLVGAVFFASVVAIVLPMVMDQDPRPPVQDVEIRIPGQDDKPFTPALVAAPAPQESAPASERPQPAEAPAKPVPAAEPVALPAVKPTARIVDTEAAGSPKAEPKTAEKAPAKSPEKSAEKAPEKPLEKAKVADKTKAADDAEARRAAAILAGKSPDAAKPAASSGEYLILIGAFSDAANVANLKKKLGEQGIRTFTEPLDTPQGKKTRVRAGPFPSRDAADKALDKMRRIGVSGVVAAKQ